MPTNEPFSIRQWLAGLPVSSIGWVFVVAGVLVMVAGTYDSYTRWGHDRSLEQEGRVANGTVLEKTARTTIERQAGRRSHEGGTIETHYLVTFRFSASGEDIAGTAEVDRDVWDRLQEQDPIRVTYLPDKPEIHRLEGQDTDFQLWKLLLWLAGGGLFLYAGKLLLAGKLQLGSLSESDD
jgi:hypothetical protein